MKYINFVITLQDDCIFSESNATEGAHAALDYIPGSALLGAVAARLYQSDDLSQAFQWFHSGQVRFGNAYPLSASGERTYPMPACWHEAKNDSAIDDNKIDDSKVWRLDQLSEMQLSDNKQPKQMRTGYVSATGEYINTHKTLRMKSAIDPQTGRAKEGVLFGYDALKAGQKFYAQVSIEDALGDECLTAIKHVLTQPLLLGRSRSAEYGRATTQMLDKNDPLKRAGGAADKLTLWLQSDLMILDQYGQPSFYPSLEALLGNTQMTKSLGKGLLGATFSAKESFIRTRRYSTWNAYKRGYEMERQVMCKGSVLVYQLSQQPDAHQLDILESQLASGVGLERQAGLGQVWLNPELLSGERPVFKKEFLSLIQNKQDIQGGSENNSKAEPSALIKWLAARNTHTGSRQKDAQQARHIAKCYEEILVSARQLTGRDQNLLIGPSLSQWGMLLSGFKNDPQYHHTLLRLQQSGNWQGSFKPTGEGWCDSFLTNQQELITFHTWFMSQVQPEQQASPASHYLLSQLIREIMGHIKSAKGGQ